jgi:hypothetical protein
LATKPSRILLSRPFISSMTVGKYFIGTLTKTCWSFQLPI